MMTFEKVGDHVGTEPFRPFRMNMASGVSFDIRHPEMILAGRMSVRAYAQTGIGEAERWHDLSLMLMESIEPLDVAAAPSV